MAHVVAVMVHYVGYFVRTIWGLQERRFASTFDAVSSAAISVSITFVLCLFSISNSQRRGATMASAAF
ncbi:hypothetical protein QN277_003330 [Acacia crassicarpa]|uniref:Uncharacterized protein n=1 Tax=Acacia crassicarpa TaxID=499986 RepID=A0AAE1IY67_9FABA|nr:hypothetical protein QN277_003330 [Acacia crassicarpa]